MSVGSIIKDVAGAILQIVPDTMKPALVEEYMKKVYIYLTQT